MSQLVNQSETQENNENLATGESISLAERIDTPKDETLSVVAKRAIEVFGNKQKAMRWLGTPIPALEYATPVSMLDSEEGVDAVLTILGRIEHGIF